VSDIFALPLVIFALFGGLMGGIWLTSSAAQPHRLPQPAAMQPNCTSDRLDYEPGKLPRFHVGLYPRQESWDVGCPDWRRRHTWGMA